MPGKEDRAEWTTRPGTGGAMRQRREGWLSDCVLDWSHTQSGQLFLDSRVLNRVIGSVCDEVPGDVLARRSLRTCS